jgi:hypothetical protein
MVAECPGCLSRVGVLMYKASFDTHQVTVLIAVSMTLLLSLDVLALFCFGTLCVESKGLEHLGSLSSVRVGVEDPLGYCCLHCFSLSPVALGKGKVGQVTLTVVELRQPRLLCCSLFPVALGMGKVGQVALAVVGLARLRPELSS